MNVQHHILNPFFHGKQKRICIIDEREYYGIVEKNRISRVQLRLVLLVHRNAMNSLRRDPTTQCFKKRKLDAIVLFYTDQSVFCDLQDFFQVNFRTLKLTSTHVI